MYIVHAEPGKAICLGREGESLARQVVFDVYEWQEMFGEGVVQLIAQRMGDDQPYPCVVEMDGNHAVWTITNADTARPGNYGKCELSYYVGETLVKSETWPTIVLDAMCEPSDEAPEPYQGWLDKILAAGSYAEAERIKSEQAADNAGRSAQSAEDSASAAALSEQNIKQSEANCKKSEESAALSADKAKASADNAKNAVQSVADVATYGAWLVPQETLKTLYDGTIHLGTNKNKSLTEKLFDMVDGKEYTITYEGQEYECVCHKVVSGKYTVTYIGNASKGMYTKSFAHVSDDTGEPFLYEWIEYSTTSQGFFWGDKSDDDVAFKAETVEMVVQKMPEQHLPDNVATKADIFGAMEASY